MFLSTTARPSGETFEINPLSGFDSTVPTIVYVSIVSSLKSLIVTFEPKTTPFDLVVFSEMILTLARMFSISLILPSISACLFLAAS